MHTSSYIIYSSNHVLRAKAGMLGHVSTIKHPTPSRLPKELDCNSHAFLLSSDYFRRRNSCRIFFFVHLWIFFSFTCERKRAKLWTKKARTVNHFFVHLWIIFSFTCESFFRSPVNEKTRSVNLFFGSRESFFRSPVNHFFLESCFIFLESWMEKLQTCES